MLNVHDLARRPGEMMRENLELTVPEFWGTAVIGIRPQEELDVELRLESVLEGVLVTGQAQSEARGECVRCLDEVVYELDANITALFAYPERAKAAEESGDDDEDEVFVIDHDDIDLEPVIRDSLVTALPFQPLCDRDCPGLCPECGIRLADHPDHKHDSVDIRWAGLQEAFGANQASDDTKES
ncbi:uncharacterized protein FB461_0572 [Rarobacter faecitabidus]|uniref:Metal-binding protein n=1 Tax=Rarobacter faecitabidus TaxID=13243 RepID=A0A542ZUR8_RARFA|nr:uncharacterized protein FB461_0572 [Rarobacter faecitabidus]